MANGPSFRQMTVYIDIKVANGPTIKITFGLSELLTETQYMCHSGPWIIQMCYNISNRMNTSTMTWWQLKYIWNTCTKLHPNVCLHSNKQIISIYLLREYYSDNRSNLQINNWSVEIIRGNWIPVHMPFVNYSNVLYQEVKQFIAWIIEHIDKHMRL